MPFSIRAAFPGDQQYLLRVLRRALLFWGAVRLVLAAMAWGATGSAAIAPVVSVMLIPLVAAICAIDARFMRETIFQANLGTPTVTPALAGAVTAALGALVEVVLLSLRGTVA